MNISSIVVHARPGSAEAVRGRLEDMRGVEVHAVSPEGKLVVTIETEGDDATVAAFEAINRMEGVLSASMVFHQNESDPDKEVSNEPDAA
ncbi:MAG TPA: chaperone NapD [Rhodocyclaceae bacterium]|nr:chaperone NapD [Rhodocyclaceae bacterium]